MAKKRDRAGRRKTKRDEELLEFEDDDEYLDVDEDLSSLSRSRRRSQAPAKQQLSRKKQDMLVLVIAIILITGTLGGYFFVYGFFGADTSSDNDQQTTGNLSGELFVISDLTQEWDKHSWHILNINGITNYLLKVTNTGAREEIYELSDDNEIKNIQIKYNKNSFKLKPGSSSAVILDVTSDLTNEYRVPTPINVFLKARSSTLILDTVQIDLTIKQLDEKNEALDGDKVSAYYLGSFINGTVFDKSMRDVQAPQPLLISLSDESQYNKFNEELEYVVVIPGFENGIIGMIPGETHVVAIPPEQAYDAGELKGLTLIFEIRLLSNDRLE